MILLTWHIDYEFAPPVCPTSLPHEFAPRVCPTSLLHEFAPRVCPTSLPHQFAPRVCPTSLPYEFAPRVWLDTGHWVLCTTSVIDICSLLTCHFFHHCDWFICDLIVYSYYVRIRIRINLFRNICETILIYARNITWSRELILWHQPLPQRLPFTLWNKSWYKY